MTLLTGANDCSYETTLQGGKKMRRLLLALGVALTVLWSNPAGALPECYYAQMPVPDGGDPVRAEACPM